MIHGLVLAAGGGTRFGAPKMLARVGGIEIVRHVVDRLAATGMEQLFVTVGQHAAEIEVALQGAPVTLVHVPHADQGLSVSLRTGVNALPEDCTGFVVALGDQPLIDPAVVRQLWDTWETSNAAAVVPVYRDSGRGNPVFFDATMRSRLGALTGDHGARELLVAMGDRVVEVPIDATAPRDVDTPGDLLALGA